MTFEIWLKACEANNSKYYPLEGYGETALYKCWKDYIGPDQHEYHESPVYIGFVGGKEVCAVMNYHSALAAWKNRVKEREEILRKAGYK